MTFLDSKDKKIMMDIQAKNTKHPLKKKIRLPLDFAQHIQGLMAMDKETAKPLGKEMGRGWCWGGSSHLLWGTACHLAGGKDV